MTDISFHSKKPWKQLEKQEGEVSVLAFLTISSSGIGSSRGLACHDRTEMTAYVVNIFLRLMSYVILMCFQDINITNKMS